MARKKTERHAVHFVAKGEEQIIKRDERGIKQIIRRDEQAGHPHRPHRVKKTTKRAVKFVGVLLALAFARPNCRAEEKPGRTLAAMACLETEIEDEPPPRAAKRSAV